MKLPRSQDQTDRCMPVVLYYGWNLLLPLPGRIAAPLRETPNNSAGWKCFNFARFNLGSLAGLTSKAILIVCDTTKTTYEFCLLWFGTRRSKVQILSPRPTFTFRTLKDQIKRLSVCRRETYAVRIAVLPMGVGHFGRD